MKWVFAQEWAVGNNQSFVKINSCYGGKGGASIRGDNSWQKQVFLELVEKTKSSFSPPPRREHNTSSCYFPSIHQYCDYEVAGNKYYIIMSVNAIMQPLFHGTWKLFCKTLKGVISVVVCGDRCVLSPGNVSSWAASKARVTMATQTITPQTTN